MKSSDDTANINDALVLLLSDLENPAKTREGGGGAKKYKYAELPDILNQVRPELAKCGLALIMETITNGPTVGVTARFLHRSGEWLELGPLTLPAGNDAQSAGSALTYSRRYLLCAALGIAGDDDDDGEKTKRASARKTKPKEEWGEAVTAPKDSEGVDTTREAYGEGATPGAAPTSSELSPPDGAGDGEPTDTSGTVTPSSPSGESDDPAPNWLWKEASAAKLTGARAFKGAVADVKAGTLPGPMPATQSDITTRQLRALIEKLGEKT